MGWFGFWCGKWICGYGGGVDMCMADKDSYRICAAALPITNDRPSDRTIKKQEVKDGPDRADGKMRYEYDITIRIEQDK